MFPENFSFTPLGGGREIGANCYYLEWDGIRFLIDAGMHPERQAWLALPELHRIHRLDFILLTHAHNDHLGSLPYLHRLFPRVPVYMTEATRDLAAVMLPDAVRFQRLPDPEGSETNAAIDQLYSEEDVHALLGAALPLDDGMRFRDLEVIAFPNGHILGSVGLLLRKNGRQVLFTSDICLEEKDTSVPAAIPAVRPDLLILESTYGRDLVPGAYRPRPIEEEAMLEAVAEIARGGGSVLFPAFVIERAQAVVGLLNAGVAARRLPRRPLCLLGMGRSVARITHRRLGLELRYSEARVRDIEAMLDRGEACYIVCGSGMLNAGSSAARLAARLIQDPEHGIIFSGYCSPRSSGWRLINNQGNTHYVNGRLVKGGGARVRQFHMSGHAIGYELLELVQRLAPGAVCLVHGDREAMASLGGRLEAMGYPVHAPETNETVPATAPRAMLGPPLARFHTVMSKADQAGRTTRARQAAGAILARRPWDLDALALCARADDEEGRASLVKYRLLLKSFIEKDIVEGNLARAREWLFLLPPDGDEGYILGKERQLGVLANRLGGG